MRDNSNLVKNIGWFVISTWFILFATVVFLIISRPFEDVRLQEMQYYRGVYTICLAQVNDANICNKAISELYNHDLYNKDIEGFKWLPVQLNDNS